MAGDARELMHRLAVPFEAEPCQAIEDRGDRLVGRARAVGVLDAQQEFAATPARIKPVEQCGARAADVQEAGRRGRKAGDDLIRHWEQLNSGPHPEERPKGASRRMAACAVAPPSFETPPARLLRTTAVSVARRVAQLRAMQHIWQ